MLHDMYYQTVPSVVNLSIDAILKLIENKRYTPDQIEVLLLRLAEEVKFYKHALGGFSHKDIEEMIANMHKESL
jgi:hypothetical protein